MASTETKTNWGRWGPDDERGALNLVTPEIVLQTARGLSSGKVYSLGLPISKTRTPKVFDRPPPERYTRTSPHDVLRAPAAAGADETGEGDPRVGAADDILVMASHTGTHLDALSHVFEGDRFYNGHSVESFTTNRGAGKCSVVKTGTSASRCVLLDVAASSDASEAGALPPGYTVTAGDLDRCCSSHGLEVRPGDAVLIRTGWVELLRKDPEIAVFPQAGIGVEAASWLTEHDVSIVGADNSAVEVLPFEGGALLPVHVALIVRAGVGLLEHLWLADMAADGCHEALLVIAALPVVGATGSPVNPVAIG